MPTVTLRNASRLHTRHSSRRDVDLTFEARGGETTVLVGPPGSGKTSAVRLAAGHERFPGGSILFDGIAPRRTRGRNDGVALVEAVMGIDPHRTVAEHLGKAVRVAGRVGWGRDRRVDEVVERLRLGEVLTDPVGRLSAGQLRRVLVARAVVARPALLLLDEPFADTDELTADIVRRFLLALREERRTVIYTTSSRDEVFGLADRIVVLHDGTVRDSGTPADILERPGTVHAAVLGDPPMNLVETSVQVIADHSVVLGVGEQYQWLPWNDVRSRALARYHGERIVLGVRPELVRFGRGDLALNGCVSGVEHRASGTFARVAIGAGGVDLGPTVADGHRARRPGVPLTRSVPGAVLVPPDQSQRPADFRIRLPARGGPDLRRPLGLGFGLDAVHAFDGLGNRIDLGPFRAGPSHAPQ